MQRRRSGRAIARVLGGVLALSAGGCVGGGGGNGGGGGGSGGGGGGDMGPSAPPAGAVFGEMTGEWALTFDSGDFTGMALVLGGGDDGRTLTVTTRGAEGRISYGPLDPDSGAETGCRAATDEVHLRVTASGEEMFGHAYTRYRCGPMRDGEGFFDIADWDDARFDRENIASTGSALAWKTHAGEGDHGVLDGGWHIEMPNVLCWMRISPDGALTGTCRAGPWRQDLDPYFEVAGRIAGAMASGSVDEVHDFAAERIGDARPGPRPPLEDGLGGATGRWQIWGNRQNLGLHVGAVLDVRAAGTALDATMQWNPIELLDWRGDTTRIEQSLTVDLDVDGGAPGGSAAWHLVESQNGQVVFELARTFTATRVDAAPAAIPLLGGEWMLIDDADPERISRITVDGETLRVVLPDEYGPEFVGHLDPRQVTGVHRAYGDELLHGDRWVSGRRVGN